MRSFSFKFLIFFSFIFIISSIRAELPTNKISEQITSSEKINKSSLKLKEIFSTSPLIYSTLLVMSIFAFTIWIYTLFTFRIRSLISKNIRKKIKELAAVGKCEDIISFCKTQNNSLFSRTIISALSTDNLTPQIVYDAIKLEGKKTTASFWQRLSLLNDIVMIAPMLGLLGTVLGMFYAFYDVNKSIESISSLFDGLGIAVGTTVAGLLVAILAMIFHTMLKYRVARALRIVENEAFQVMDLIQR